MKKIASLCCFISILFFAKAQETSVEKGKSVYVEQVSANNEVKDYSADIKDHLNDWGYWKLASDKNTADYVFKVNVDSKKGITATSWGGQTVITNVAILSPKGDVLYQSEKYEASPNGLNGFNGGRASIKKLFRAIRKKFK